MGIKECLFSLWIAAGIAACDPSQVGQEGSSTGGPVSADNTTSDKPQQGYIDLSTPAVTCNKGEHFCEGNVLWRCTYSGNDASTPFDCVKWGKAQNKKAACYAGKAMRDQITALDKAAGSDDYAKAYAVWSPEAACLPVE